MLRKVGNVCVLIVATSLMIACTTTNVIRETEQEVRIEAASNKVSVHCTPEDREDKNSFTYLFIFGKNRIDSFVFRRPWTYQDCKKNKLSIQKVLSSNSRVIVVGQERLPRGEPGFEVDDAGYRPNNSERKPHFAWFFDHIKGDKGCHGYFEQACN